MQDSAVRMALKKAAAAERCGFSGLRPHSLRRANITWRQEVGGSSIEVSKIAGDASRKITEHQEELTHRNKVKLAKATEHSDSTPTTQGPEIPAH